MHAAGPCALTLYLLEYGDGYFAENPDAQLALVDFVRGNRTPVPQVSVSGEVNGLAPFEVEFSSAGTTDAYGDRLAYAWDSDADGVVDSRVQNPTFTYEENGVYEATLKVPDRTGPDRSQRRCLGADHGRQHRSGRGVRDPRRRQDFAFVDRVAFEIQVTDDTPVDCSRVTVSYILGHDTHGHPLTSTTGCTGSIQTIVDTGHFGEANLRGVFNARYSDVPADPDLPSLSGSDEVVLEPTN